MVWFKKVWRSWVDWQAMKLAEKRKRIERQTPKQAKWPKCEKQQRWMETESRWHNQCVSKTFNLGGGRRMKLSVVSGTLTDWVDFVPIKIYFLFYLLNLRKLRLNHVLTSSRRSDREEGGGTVSAISHPAIYFMVVWNLNWYNQPTCIVWRKCGTPGHSSLTVRHSVSSCL